MGQSGRPEAQKATRRRKASPRTLCSVLATVSREVSGFLVRQEAGFRGGSPPTLPWLLPPSQGTRERVWRPEMEVPGRDGGMPASRAQGVRDDCPFPPAAAGGRETGLGHLHVSGPASLPPTNSLPNGEGRGRRDDGGSLSLEPRYWARAARRRSSYTGVGLRTPLHTLPAPGREWPPLSPGFPSAAPPARPVVVVDCAGPLTLSTHFSTRPRSIVNAPHCPTQPLFVQRGAGKANTHN